MTHNQEKLLISSEGNDLYTVTIINDRYTIPHLLQTDLLSNSHSPFVGYTIPRLAEPIAKIRIRTDGTPIASLLRDSLTRLHTALNQITINNPHR